MQSLAHFLLILFTATSAAFAQSQARVTGTITDNSNAVVAGATVSLRNVDTGVVTTATSNGSGIYTAPFLNPGQ